MSRLFWGAENCTGATSERSGRYYKADRQGFITVNDPADAAFLKAGGYIEAGGMPHLSTYWLCECGFEAAIKHCPKCDREDLSRVSA